MVDAPPQPIDVPERLTSAPVLYNADTGARVGGDLQRYAGGFRLPAGASVKVRLAPTDSSDGVRQDVPAAFQYGATADDDVLYFDPANPVHQDPREARNDVLHELAHRYDRRYATDATRQQFEQILGDTRPWRADVNSPHEQFADALAAYLAGQKMGGGGYDFDPDAGQRAQLRKLFASLESNPPQAVRAPPKTLTATSLSRRPAKTARSTRRARARRRQAP